MLVAEGLACYRRGELAAARVAWERARELSPVDPRAAEYLEHMENVAGAGEELELELLPAGTDLGGVAAPSGDAADARPTADLSPLGDARPTAELSPQGDARPTADLSPQGDGRPTAELSPPAEERPTAELSPQGDERPTAELSPPIELSSELDDSLEQSAPPGDIDFEASLAGASDDETTGTEYEPSAIRERILSEVGCAGDGDEVGRRVDALLAIVRRELDAGRGLRAAVAADLAGCERPDSAAAQKRLHEHAGTLLRAYEQVLGDGKRVPLVALPLHELPTRSLDSRTAFLLSRVDGVLSVEEILDVSGMPRLEASGYLVRLVLQGLLEVR